MNEQAVGPLKRAEPLPEHSGVEYEQAHEYIRHMYETRHTLINYYITVNGILFGAVIQFVKDDIDKILISFSAICYSTLMTAGAFRSLRFYYSLNDAALKIESKLGLSLLADAQKNMPNGLDSNTYFKAVYVLVVMGWTVFSLYIAVIHFGWVSAFELKGQ